MRWLFGEVLLYSSVLLPQLQHPKSPPNQVPEKPPVIQDTLYTMSYALCIFSMSDDKDSLTSLPGFQVRDPYAEDEGDVPQHCGLHESQLPFWRGKAKILKMNWVNVSLQEKKIENHYPDTPKMFNQCSNVLRIDNIGAWVIEVYP